MAVDLLWQTPIDIELSLLLIYVVALLIAARIIEALAKSHYRRAHRFAEHGFEYVEPRDHFRCLGGAQLELHTIYESERMAIYRAPVEHCGGCQYKPQCAPQEASRTVYRSLATWAESDVGRFQHCISLVMYGIALLLAIVAVSRWYGEPGTGYAMLSLGGSLGCLALQAHRMKAATKDKDQGIARLPL